MAVDGGGGDGVFAAAIGDDNAMVAVAMTSSVGRMAAAVLAIIIVDCVFVGSAGDGDGDGDCVWVLGDGEIPSLRGWGAMRSAMATTAGRAQAARAATVAEREGGQ